MNATESTLAADTRYADHVNPQWSRLLHVLGMDVSYESCAGAELHTVDGRTILDFLSGYCVHNIGHNHPYVIGAIRDELERRGPAMLQSHVPELTGELAARLLAMAGMGLTKASFYCSGSEAVEAAIKFARARTRRDALLSAEGAFHGLTCGALSLMGDPFWKEGFGKMLESARVPFGDIEALRQKLSTRRFAAFFVEPIQGESGIRIPPPNYLSAAKALCEEYDSLLVLDEVQTGLGRTGTFLAAHPYGVKADMVLLAKALSGGGIPCSAVLMTEPIYGAVYSSIQKSIVHTSTFSENALSMRAALATLDVLDQEDLAQRASVMGEHLRSRLREELLGFEMVKEIRGAGLLNGIEFQPPRQLRLRAAFESFHYLHPALFGQVVVMRLFREHNILTQICGNAFMVLKAAPPLMIGQAQIDKFVAALRATMEEAHSSAKFWTEPLGLARRILGL